MTIGLLVDLKLELAKYGFETDSNFSIISESDAAFVYTRNGKSWLMDVTCTAKEFKVSVQHNGHEAYSGIFARPHHKMAEFIISDYTSYAGFQKVTPPAPEQPVETPEAPETPAAPAEAEKPVKPTKKAKKPASKPAAKKPAAKKPAKPAEEDMPDFES